MKRLLSVLLTFSLLVILPVSATAASPVAKTTTVTNEFEAMLSLNQKNDGELAAQGYNNEDINTIRNAVSLFDEHIEFLGTLSDENLLAAGYSQSQIQGIKSYNPETSTNSTRAALSGECETFSTIDNYTGTSGRVTSEFVWTGIPAFKLTDVLITTWNNWQIKGKSANVKYTHIYGSEPSFWQAPTYQPPESGQTSFGSGYSYPAALKDNYFYASEGYSIFTLSCQSNQHLETTARVSHARLSLDFTYGILGGPDISIDSGRDLLGTGRDEKP